MTATVRVIVEGAPLLRLAMRMIWAWCRHGKAVLVFTGIADGSWDSCGCSGWTDEKKMAEAETMIDCEDLDGCNRFWIEAELPIPEAKKTAVVQATVVEA